ncbi:MAG TPA: DNA adenine methylase [Phycisphaerales bacterium]|nr:DNA adenine methylase [Phycisphaerales bacterium]
MIKYLGSKRLLLGQILRTVHALGPSTRTVLDLFSGTSRVGHALKAKGYRVLSSDNAAYAATLARCYVQAERAAHAVRAQAIIDDLNALPGAPGYFTETFCVRSRFFRPENGARIDAIREHIAAARFEPELESILLVTLMEAADRVDSTTGVQMAYLKRWAPRALKPLTLRLPDLLDRAPDTDPCRAHHLDALDAASLGADAAYIDPPYNQHSYLGNYHVWESLVRWDKPETYGIACKRTDTRERRSPFNSRRACAEALGAVIARVRAPNLILSFNNEGFLSLADLHELLMAQRGVPRTHLTTLAFDFKRYVGAQIGIYNPRGNKVGTVGALRNVEHIIVATAERPGRALRELARQFAGPVVHNPVAHLHPEHLQAIAG